MQDMEKIAAVCNLVDEGVTFDDALSLVKEAALKDRATGLLRKAKGYVETVKGSKGKSLREQAGNVPKGKPKRKQKIRDLNAKAAKAEKETLNARGKLAAGAIGTSALARGAMAYNRMKKDDQ